MVDLNELEALLAKATPGPWELPAGPSSASDIFSDGDWNIYPPTGEAGPVAIASGEHNAVLIAAAVNALPSLIQRIRELERVEACAWERDADSDAWDSACGEKWQFTTDGPAENGVRFCHGCGKPVHIVTSEARDDG